MKYKTFPMGSAATERMEQRGLKAFLSHAVIEPCHDQIKTICGAKTSSLCLDDSLATTDLPDCPRCQAKINKTVKSNN